MADSMSFPDTFDEFAERYKITDKEEVYTNGSELIPIFRVKQWLEHTAIVTQCTCNYNNTTKTNDMSECQKGNHMWECCGISTAGSTYRCKVCGKTKTENYYADKHNITISNS